MVNTTQENPLARPLDRLLYGSPLHKTGGKIIFIIILSITVVLALSNWINLLTDPPAQVSVLLLGTLFGLLGSIPLFLLILYLDRRERESWYIYLGIPLLVMLFFEPAAGRINDLSPAAVLTVGFNEEFWKILPLLLFVFFAPSMVTGVRDGLIYGALSGMAFNIVELGTYIWLDSFPELGWGAFAAQAGRLGLLGVDSHVIWSALLGAAIGYATMATTRKGRYGVPIAVFLLVAFTHTLQDTLGGAFIMVAIQAPLMLLQGVDMDSTAQVASFNQQYGALTSILEMLVINIVIIPILLVAIIRSGNWERRVIKNQLQDEQSEDVTAPVTKQEYEGVVAEKRFHVRRVPDYPRKVSNAIRNSQNKLAFRKEQLQVHGSSLGEDLLAQAWREDIVELRDIGENQ
jgi:RsiW-degrading membrane proteinase PrsW (M82 family)